MGQRKKHENHLRIYRTQERLRYDFERMVKALSNIDGVKILPNQKEIRVSDALRIRFVLDDITKVAGLRPDEIHIDEFVSTEVRDYLQMASPEK